MNGRALRISVIMPVFNERRTVERAIRRLRETELTIELICVDDGSTDGSLEIVRRLESAGLVDRLIAHGENRGKGRSVRDGIACATGDVVVIHDADLEYDPGDLPGLLQPIADGRADAVFGSRFLAGPRRVLYFWHRVGNNILTLVSNMFTDLDLTDMETCYKIIRRDLLISLPLRSDRFGIEPELTARLAQSGARIYEMPISYRGRTYEEGKKIGWKDGVAAFWHILRSNLLPPRAPRFARGVEAEEPPDWIDRPEIGPTRTNAAAANGATASTSTSTNEEERVTRPGDLRRTGRA